jgi:hypothetical protein
MSGDDQGAEIKSAIATKSVKQQLDEAKARKATLRGRQVNLTPDEEAELKTLGAEIESLEKNLAIETAKNVGLGRIAAASPSILA